MNIGKILTEWALVPLWTTIKKILHIHEHVTNVIKTKKKGVLRDKPDGPTLLLTSKTIIRT